MKKTLLFASVCLPLWGVWGVAAWHGYKEPKLRFRETVKVVSPENVEAHVTLTKWQMDKMLSWYEEDAHPSDTIRFKTVVKSDGEGWRISSTHLAKSAEPASIPKGKFVVVDSSYVDHAGDFKSCVEYADSYKKFHDYVVLSAE